MSQKVSVHVWVSDKKCFLPFCPSLSCLLSPSFALVGDLLVRIQVERCKLQIALPTTGQWCTLSDHSQLSCPYRCGQWRSLPSLQFPAALLLDNHDKDGDGAPGHTDEHTNAQDMARAKEPQLTKCNSG